MRADVSCQSGRLSGVCRLTRLTRQPRARVSRFGTHFLAVVDGENDLSLIELALLSVVLALISKMAEYDLTKTIIPYCDRHLVFPLLAHLAESDLFPVEQVQAAQYELAKETNMVDYAVNLFQQLHPDEEAPQGAPLLHRPLLCLTEPRVCGEA